MAGIHGLLGNDMGLPFEETGTNVMKDSFFFFRWTVISAKKIEKTRKTHLNTTNFYWKRCVVESSATDNDG